MGLRDLRLRDGVPSQLRLISVCPSKHVGVLGERPVCEQPLVRKGHAWGDNHVLNVVWYLHYIDRNLIGR